MLILTAHHVIPDNHGLSNEGDTRWLSLTQGGLRNVIRLMRRLGYTWVSLQELYQLGRAGLAEKYGPRCVAMTFDDGFKDNWTYGDPVLQDEGCAATIFLVADHLGKQNTWDKTSPLTAAYGDILSEDDVHAWAQQNPSIRFGSHAWSHDDLPALDPTTCFTHLQQANTFFTQRFSPYYLPVLAYPYGYFSPVLYPMLYHAGYHWGFTTKPRVWGADDSPYAIPRITIFQRDANPIRLLLKLRKFGAL